MNEHNPYQSPIVDAEIISSPYAVSAPSGVGIWRKGDKLIMHKSAQLPNICVKTNLPAERRVRKTLSWHPPALIALILAGLLVYVIVALIMTKKAAIEIPVTNDWMASRRKQIWIALIVALVGALMLPAGIAAASYDALPEEVPLLLYLGSAFTGLGGLIAAAMVARIVWPSKITDSHIHLSGVNRDLLAQFPVWSGN